MLVAADLINGRTAWAGRRLLAATLAVAVALLLAACGDEEAATTPAAATRATGVQPGGGSPAAAGEPRTLGDLADRVDAAWAGVGAFRSVFVVTPPTLASPVAGSPAASPAPAAGQVEIVREVVAADRQRFEQRADGALISEAIVADGRVYVRGAAARTLLPEADPAVWVEGDPAALPPVAGGDPLLARIVAPIASPLSAVPGNLRPQELRPLGPVDVAGRTCQAYGAAATTATGTRIDITIAVGRDDLPCFVETRAGGAGGRETFDAYGQPFAIAPPAASTPVAVPGAPATPEGRD